MTKNETNKKILILKNKKRKTYNSYSHVFLKSKRKNRKDDALFDEILRKYAKAWRKLSEM